LQPATFSSSSHPCTTNDKSTIKIKRRKKRRKRRKRKEKKKKKKEKDLL
jgi:hypothetical protein